MKARNLFLALALVFGLGTTGFALTPEELAIKKCHKQLRKELRKSLRGPSFDYLKPDCCESVIVKFVVTKENKLQFHKIIGEDQQLMDYIKTTFENKEIIVSDTSLQGKMLRFPINFKHKQH